MHGRWRFLAIGGGGEAWRRLATRLAPPRGGGFPRLELPLKALKSALATHGPARRCRCRLQHHATVRSSVMWRAPMLPRGSRFSILPPRAPASSRRRGLPCYAAARSSSHAAARSSIKPLPRAFMPPRGSSFTMLLRTPASSRRRALRRRALQHQPAAARFYAAVRSSTIPPSSHVMPLRASALCPRALQHSAAAHSSIIPPRAFMPLAASGLCRRALQHSAAARSSIKPPSRSSIEPPRAPFPKRALALSRRALKHYAATRSSIMLPRAPMSCRRRSSTKPPRTPAQAAARSSIMPLRAPPHALRRVTPARSSFKPQRNITYHAW